MDQYIIISPKGFLNGNQTFSENPHHARKFELDAAMDHMLNFGVKGTIVPFTEAYEFRLYLLTKADYYTRHHKLTNHPRDLELAAQCDELAESLTGLAANREEIPGLLAQNEYTKIALAELALNKHKSDYLSTIGPSYSLFAQKAGA